ncbi:MAG TPA: class I SAM-dependent methyltransferase [Cyclobacteriaceae bacterium]|jgi:ubiquinone/menaquinone biosynthesis C-methylase UbiE|nr:class I SAM-dependent methyltransferase [Cyclobacteriaceae bacterium]
MKSNDFDNLAFVYDKLARLVFGKSIVQSQQFFLHRIPDRSRVLILGGGSGWILEKLLEARPTVEVCYIEASQNMISLAQDRIQNDTRIQFINGTENEIPNRAFDVIIANFYLDLFEDQSLKPVLQKMKSSLAPNGEWLITDFVDRTWWHRTMLKIMYLFFKATTKIEAGKLPDWSAAVVGIGGIKTDSKSFYGDFIEATVFQF